MTQGISKAEQQQIGATIKKGLAEDDFEESIDDLDKATEAQQQARSKRNNHIWEAVEASDNKKVEQYLDTYELKHQDLFDEVGNTMLHKAAQFGNVEILMLLIDRTGAKPEILNQNLATPLHIACRSNQENVVRFLVGLGVDVNLQDEHGQTPLLICCIHGHLELGKTLVEASIAGHTEQIDVDLKDARGLTPLNCAAIKGDFRFTELLIEKGNANIEEASPKGCTPLLYAGRGGFIQIVKLLVKKGVNTMRQDNAGGTVVHHAIEKGQEEVVRFLIDQQIDMDIADNAGRTPLFEAVENNLENIVELLLKFKANPNITNYSGHTPLFCAAREGDVAIVKALVEGKAKIDHFGLSSVRNDELEDEDIEDEFERNLFEGLKCSKTPLHVSSLLGYDEIVKCLVTNGSNPNIEGEQNYSALHFAILGRKPEIAEYLLMHTNANPYHKDKKGVTCAQMAFDKFPEYKEDFEKLLKDKGEVQPEDEEHIAGLTPVKEEESIHMLNESAGVIIATHYYNPDDERSIQGGGDNIFHEAQEQAPKEQDQNILKMKTEEIKVELGREVSEIVQTAFGYNIALGIIAQNWKQKEGALNEVTKILPNILVESEQHDLDTAIKAALICVSETCQDKVIKVFASSVALFSYMIGSKYIEEKGLECFVRNTTDLDIISKLLLKSEDGNARSTSKVHEAVMDFSYHPGIGEGFAATYLISRIHNHIKNSTKQAKVETTDTQETEEDQRAPTQFKPPISGQNVKGLLAQLQLLYKFIVGFGISQKSGPLGINSIKLALIPNLQHSNADVRQAAAKILMEVHKRTGIVDDDFLKEVSTNIKQSLLSKIESVQVNQNLDIMKDKENVSPSKIDIAQAMDKAKNKEWSDKEFTLKKFKDDLTSNPAQVIKSEQFTDAALSLMKECLEVNNITLHLAAIDLANEFLQHALQHNYDVALLFTVECGINLAQKTTHTNTRVKKKSEECLLFAWDGAFNHINSKFISKVQSTDTSVSAKIMSALMTTDERAIQGRLGVIGKRLQRILGENSIIRNPHQVLMGANYIEIAQFCCDLCENKNAKVRQSASKVLVELCKLNASDQHGKAFRDKIVELVLKLKPAVRDPIINKVNTISSFLLKGQMFFKTNILEDYDENRGRHMSQERIQSKRTFSQGPLTASTGALPSIKKQADDSNSGDVTLPHFEPLSEEQKQKYNQWITLFSEPLIGCFLSQSWSNRLAALQKLKEQSGNLDPAFRDAMKTQINKQNYSCEESYPIVIEFLKESITKDPVLKNYLITIELVQKLMPTYFRSLSQNAIQKSITGLIESILKKTSDLKIKVREASINVCIYFSHQSPVGPEFMMKQIVLCLDSTERQKDVASNIGNSNLWASCLQLIAHIQNQAKLANSLKSSYTQLMMKYVNAALKHNTPNVRKEGESLFTLLFQQFGSDLENLLTEQKPSTVKKLLDSVNAQTGVASKGMEQKANVEKATNNINANFLPKDFIFSAEQIQDLKDPKKKQNAMVEIKKTFVQQTGGKGMGAKKALELCEPITILMRQLLNDDTADIYLDSLKLLKFFISSLAPHLTTLDLHMMISSFVGIIVSNTISSNIRVQMASDKVILYFAKHQNIGPHVVGKDIVKNIQRLAQSLNKFTNSAAFNSTPRGTSLTDKKPILQRFMNILNLLLQQFSLVLCYQPDFYDMLIDVIGDLLLVGKDEPSVQRSAISLLTFLHQIDPKILEQSSSKVEVTKRTQIRKYVVEIENQNKQGKNVLAQDQRQFNNTQTTSQNQSPNIPSGRNSASRTSSLFSPTDSKRGNTGGSFVDKSDGFQGSSSRGFRRMISEEDRTALSSSINKPPSGQQSEEVRMSISQARRAASLKRQTTLEADKQTPSAPSAPSVLPDINSRRALPPISQNSGLAPVGGAMPSSTGFPPSGLGSYNPGIGQNKTTRPPLPGQSGAQTEGRIRGGMDSRVSETSRNMDERNDPFRESQTKRFPLASPSGNSPGGFGDNMKRSGGMTNPGPMKASMPVATFEHGTGGYINRKAQNVEKDILDEEMKKFNF